MRLIGVKEWIGAQSWQVRELRLDTDKHLYRGGSGLQSERASGCSSWVMRVLSERETRGLDTVVCSTRQMLLPGELWHSQVSSSGEMVGTTEGPGEMWRTATEMGPSARETRKKAGTRTRHRQAGHKALLCQPCSSALVPKLSVPSSQDRRCT